MKIKKAYQRFFYFPLLNYLDKLLLLNFYQKPYFTPSKMKIPIPLNYLDKLLLLNFYQKPYFTPSKMKIPIPLNYLDKLPLFNFYLKFYIQWKKKFITEYSE